MADIRSMTVADAVFILSVPDLGITENVQGWTTDDFLGNALAPSGEERMGIDGFMSMGYIHSPRSMTIHLEATSLSIDAFSAWAKAEEDQQAKYAANATLTLKATGKSYTYTRGMLKEPVFAPDLKKTIQPSKYTIVWQKISETPV
jgi:hypothetical protein